MFYFQIPCVFPSPIGIVSVPIQVICVDFIGKTDLADRICFKGEKKSQYLVSLESGNLQLEQTQITGVFGKILKIPVFRE